MHTDLDFRKKSIEEFKCLGLEKEGQNAGPPDTEPQRQYYFMAKCRDYVKAQEKRLGRPLVCCVKTFGCQMNARDSEKLLGILRQIGFEETDTQEADLVLYNTCTVRGHANQKVYGRLGHLQAFKQKNPHMIIALCGCMMQEKEVIERMEKSYRFVDLIFGTHNIFQLAELLYQRIVTGHMVIDVWERAGQIVESLPAKRKYAFKSGVNIMFGCDNFCSYCIVPYVRGRERSRRPDDILAEVRQLVADGVVEVMLLGQNVNSYGKHLAQPVAFADLLRMVEEVDGLKRIRFMTSHPKDLSDDLIEAMKECPKVCRHLHLPIQSGSDRMLRMMNRHYTREQYFALVDRIRAAIPDISLTTDIIVGFPGETQEDFEETLDAVRRVRYDSAFTFLYSKRLGTPAADMQDQVPADVARSRFDRLLSEIQAISAQVCNKACGTIEEVLVESRDRHHPGFMTGRLSNNWLVHFPGEESFIGNIVSVKLTEAKGFYYMGTFIGVSQ